MSASPDAMPILRASLRSFGSFAFGRGSTGKLSILIYHRVLERLDPVSIYDLDVATFRWHMQLLAQCFNVLPLGEAVERLRAGTLPVRAAAVTFDDGYADNAEVALPVLRETGVSATFFVASGFLDGGRMWNDRVLDAVRAHREDTLDLQACGLGVFKVPDDAARREVALSLLERLKYYSMDERAERVDAVVECIGSPGEASRMMTSAQVKELADAGMEIGGHTVNHPILSRVDPDTARREIAQDREALEAIVGRPLTLFAYPNGRPGQDYTWEHVNIVRDLGFRAAVSTASGVSTSATDIFQLARFTPWDRSPWRFGVRMMLNARCTSSQVALAQEGL